MDKNELDKILDSTLAQLKDFQSSTVEAVYNRLYVEGMKKHLVADEVGLGKTIVAKGLIAKILKDRLAQSKKAKPLRVVYICSNQALAAKNLEKLNILSDTKESSIDVGRLIFQAYKKTDNSVIQLTSLTPSTSFRLIRGTGIQEERMLIYSILSRYKVFSKGRRDNGLKLSLIGNVEDPIKWKGRCNSHKSQWGPSIRESVYTRYKKAVSETVVPKSFKQVYKELNSVAELSVQEVLIRYSELLNVRNVRKYWGHIQLLSLLRALLTEICLDYIDADLYILDEFQRFKDLIDTEGKVFEDLTEAAAVAKKIFEKSGSKVLMLSATPFKQFSTQPDEENEDSHFKEFQTVLSFLLGNGEDLKSFTKHRKQFFELLRRPGQIDFENVEKLASQIQPKLELEKIYRKVISRTERHIVSDDKNTLISHRGNDSETEDVLKLRKEDVDDFRWSDAIMQSLSENSDIRLRNTMAYVLSSPYALSYLDRYKIKELLAEHKENPSIKKAILKSKNAWIDWNTIQAYKPLKNIPNGKTRLIFKEILEENDMWKQLWVAPSLPYYDLEGAFTGASNCSKTLLFSKWVMVPKMIASLISYEVERRTIGDSRTFTNGEEVRRYTPPMGKKKRRPRKPTKILAFQMKEGRPGKMSAFTMLYPSLTIGLDESFSPLKNLGGGERRSLSQLKKGLAARFKVLFHDHNLDRYATVERTTVSWYWAVLVLLDKALYPESSSLCLNLVNSKNFELANEQMDSEDDSNEKHELGAAEKHFEELISLYNDPSNFGLGRIPDDLFEVIAEIAIASPAVAAFRTIKHNFNELRNSEIFKGSLEIASEFHSLFDKPESIATVQLSSILKQSSRNASTDVYWREVLGYCCDGNLQSVLDEYGHMIISDHKTIESFVKRISGTVNINTTNVKVDSVDSFLKEEHQVMRCHYAVEFGNQALDKEGGRKRISNVLDNFNSPFRPFVLASTSIGQEGLDFHYYCRKIVHWNLPSNPIDFEQREGRINRFKGLVIRQNIVKKYGHLLSPETNDNWSFLFEKAREIEGERDGHKAELIPFWHVESDDISIERITPVLPYSKEVNQLKNLLATLTLYRLTFGQPRQEELVDTLFKELDSKSIDFIRKNFMIDLCPYNHEVG